MANNVNVTIDANVQGYVDGINQAKQATADYTTETKRVQDNVGNFRKEFAAVKKDVMNLAQAYRNLSNEAKNSAFGQEMARQLNEAKQKAAEYIDLQGDLNTELRNMASDTQNLDALSQGMSVFMNTTSAALGVVAQFTGNEKDAQRAIVAFTTAQSTLNAITQISNALQKQSALMLGIQRVQTLAAAAAARVKAAAEGQGVVATRAATVAQAAFNLVASANPYVLLATAVVGVVGALAVFCSGTNDATDAQEEQNKKLEEAKKAQEEYQKTLRNTANNTIVPLYSSFLKLQSAWKLLNSEAEKQKFIKDYASEMQKLGVEINNVRDAENLFIDNEKAFVESIKLRAQAAVLMKQLEKQLENNGLTNDVVDDSKNTAPSGRYTIGEAVANETAKQLAQVEAEIDKIMSKFRSVSSNNNTTKEVKKEIQTYKEAISEYDRLAKEKAELEKLMNEGRVDPEFLEEFKQEIAGYDTKMQALVDKWHIKAKVEVEKPQISDLNKIKNEIENALNPKVEKSAKYDFSSLPEEFNKVADETIEAIKRIETARNNLTDIMNDKESTDAEISSAQQGLDQLNTAYDELLSKADVYQELSDAADKLNQKNEKITETLDGVGQAFSEIGNIMSSLGSIFDDKVLNAAGIIAQAVATYILGWTEATAKASKLGPIGWAAFGLSTAAQVLAVVEQIKNASKFDSGGIVGGSSYHGDKILTRVESGEMILNSRQQRNLFDLLDGTKMPQSGGTNVTVTGVIRGTDLLLVQKNTSKIMKKAGNTINF